MGAGAKIVCTVLVIVQTLQCNARRALRGFALASPCRAPFDSDYSDGDGVLSPSGEWSLRLDAETCARILLMKIFRATGPTATIHLTPEAVRE